MSLDAKKTRNLFFLTVCWWLKWFPDYSMSVVAAAALVDAEHQAKHHTVQYVTWLSISASSKKWSNG